MACLVPMRVLTLTTVVILVLSPIVVKSSWYEWSPRCPPGTGKVPRLIPDPTSCRRVFVCLQGGPRAYYCIRGKVFDGKKQECENQDYEDCEIDIHEYKAFDSCPPVNGADIVSFAHPTNCELYYLCDHGTALLRQCPSHLHYNPKLRVCDWPNNANCKARFLTSKP